MTIWVNSIAGTVLVGLPMLQDSLPQLQSYIPHNVFQIMMGVVIAANIILRFKTTTDLKDK